MYIPCLNDDDDDDDDNNDDDSLNNSEPPRPQNRSYFASSIKKVWLQPCELQRFSSNAAIDYLPIQRGAEIPLVRLVT